ncbi:MarR family winged helix-turn-helix transcriptional regulator [Aeromicrobium sp. 9AM]|jgi:DNA-binding MarR family transcriptional regulator|uniref:MarR family winged helix-turn-helix transcriptional regulator n=1 Tax=Aeromicrobium sp. 9AM TaxID=2653126 RepID=UPI00135C62C1|nr:MarR family transcriptional regulator [Aeromicrobium sp. 9AM]
MQTQTPQVAATAEDAVMQLMMAAGRRFRARTDGDTVDPSQATLLYTLKCRGAMRLGDIAEAMQLDASTVSRHVQQLGDRGFIDREPDPVDGRARIIALSRTGAATLKKSFDQRRAFLTQALADWDAADRERLRHDLTRLTASLGASS